MLDFYSHAGILHAEGETWERSRTAAVRVLTRVLRSGGISERVIKEEAGALTDTLATLSQQSPNGVDPRYAVHCCSSCLTILLCVIRLTRTIDVLDVVNDVHRVAVRRHVLRVTFRTLFGVDEPALVSDEQFDTAAEAFQVVQSFPRSPARCALSWYRHYRCFLISRVSKTL